MGMKQIDNLISLIWHYGEAMYQAGKQRNPVTDLIAGGIFNSIESMLKGGQISVNDVQVGLPTKQEELYKECLIDLLLMLSENTIHRADDYDLIKNKVLITLIKAKKLKAEPNES